MQKAKLKCLLTDNVNGFVVLLTFGLFYIYIQISYLSYSSQFELERLSVLFIWILPYLVLKILKDDDDDEDELIVSEVKEWLCE